MPFRLTGLAVLVLAGPLAGQALPDSTRQQVDLVFAAYDRTDSPGCALGVYRDGEIRYARGYGMANLELGIAITPGTFFDIGSTSKQFTAFAIALLEQEGRLSQTDAVRKYIPELGRYADSITVAQLVHHTSGLRDYLVLMSLAGVRDEDWTDAADALRFIARQKEANFPPNSEYLYSNTGYFLLSEIVERVSGQTLRQFAEARIFRPLGMRGSHFHDDHTMIVPGRATGYAPKDSGGYGIAMSDFEQTGDGAVQTSVEELLLWDRNFYAGTVGGMDLVRRQQVPGVLRDGTVQDYAAGLRVVKYRGLNTVRHGGAWAGYRAELLRFPDQQTSVAILCNRGDANPSALADRAADVILAGRMEPAPPAAPRTMAEGIRLPAEMLRPRVGTWRGRRTGEIRSIALEGDRLVWRFGGGTLPLTPLAADRLQLPTGTVLAFDSENSRSVMRPDGPIAGEEAFDLMPPFAPTQAQLQEYVGRYSADELGVTYDVAADSTGLVVRLNGRELARMSPLWPDTFGGAGVVMAFERANRKRLTGFMVQAGRVRNIAFARLP
jgi:CubicO group peptidase (beta-lactamase class C family)